MADSIQEEILRIANQRKEEIKLVKVRLEIFKGKNKKNKVLLPCDVCGDFFEFFKAEPRKVCGICLRDNRKTIKEMKRNSSLWETK